VRFERTPAIPAGTISMVVVGGDLIVSCGTSAVVDAAGSKAPDGGQALVPDLLLRDGALELSVCCQADEPEPCAEPSGDDLTRAYSAPRALPAYEAEWSPADDGDGESAPRLRTPLPAPARPPDVPIVVESRPPIAAMRTAPEAPADMPTRLHPIAQPVPSSRPGVASSRKTATPPKGAVVSGAGTLSRRRIAIRRIALLSMLVCAFALMMRTRQAQRTRTARIAASAGSVGPIGSVGRNPGEPPSHRPPPTASAAAPSTPPGSDARADLTLAGPSLPHPPPPDPPVATPGAPKGPMTTARRAADALAHGAYAEAIPLYEELRAEAATPGDPGRAGAEAAYRQVLRVLRARVEAPHVTAQ
jgi:hypothetical protein